MNKCILILDDDQKMLEGLEEIIRGAGYKAGAFNDPLKAIEASRTGEYGIALIDLIMPGKNGIEVLKEMREIDPGLKIIIITGFATIESSVEAIKAGASDYLTKPFKIQEVENVVKKTLEEIRFEREAIQALDSGSDEVLKALSNSIRRGIVELLNITGTMRFTDIKNSLSIEDPTKLSFHLRELKRSGLILQDREKRYSLSPYGLKIARLIKDL